MSSLGAWVATERNSSARRRYRAIVSGGRIVCTFNSLRHNNRCPLDIIAIFRQLRGNAYVELPALTDAAGSRFNDTTPQPDPVRWHSFSLKTFRSYSTRTGRLTAFRRYACIRVMSVVANPAVRRPADRFRCFYAERTKAERRGSAEVDPLTSVEVANATTL
jgi:hypothetical protein